MPAKDLDIIPWDDAAREICSSSRRSDPQEKKWICN